MENEMIRMGSKTRRRGPDARPARRAHGFSARALFAAILICSICISIFPVSPNAATTPCAINLPGQNDKSSKSARRLRKGAAIQRSMARGDAHTYLVKLDSNSYLRAAVPQRGVDIVLTLFGPDGKKIVASDRWRMIEGAESVSAVAESEGDYRIEVRASNEKAATGMYEIRIETLREATSEDRSSVAADIAFDEAERYAREGWIERSLLAAIKKYEEAAVFHQLAKDICGEADALTRIAVLYFKLGKVERSLEYCERALALNQAAGNCRGEIDTIMAAGEAYNGAGDPRKGMEYFDRALALSRAAGDRWRESWMLRQIGLHDDWANEPQKALHYFSQSLTLAEALEDLNLQALALVSRGRTYWMVGEHEKSLEAYERALPLWQALGDLGWATTTLDNMGLVYEAMGERRKALDAYAQTLTFRRTVGQRSAEADTLTGLSKIHIALGEHYKALDHLSRALMLYEDVGNRHGQAYALRSTGKAYASLGEPRKSLDYHRRALLLDRALGTPNEEAESLAGLARANRDLGDFREARANIESALYIIESQRARLTDEKLRASYFASKRGYYEFYIDLLIRMHERGTTEGHNKSAFEISERARARSLLDLLAEAGINIKQGIAPELKKREQNLNARTSQIQSRMIQARSQASLDKELIAKLEEEFKRAEDERQQLESEIRLKHSKYAEIHYPAPLRIEAVQELLDERTALLEYALGRESSFLFVVSREAMRSYRLPQASEINRLVEEVRESLGQPGRREFGRYLRAARRLYDMLIAPAAGAFSGKKRLLIAPDLALYYLPFEALLSEHPNTGGRVDYRALPYLIKQWAVSYIPSASVLAGLRRNRAGTEPETNSTARKEFVGFGDPVYMPNEANGTSNGGQAAQFIRNMIGREERLELRRLTDSGREVSGIAEPYKPEEIALYLREQASEDNVKASEHLKNARSIHFAAHGLISEKRPQYSGLVLTLNGESKEDGLLQVYEIFNLKLNADLVVLSACRTGLGKEVRGEGIMGLMRAFMYAGASSLVVSQWQVADRSTAELMVGFYQGMNGASDKTEALREAKLEMIKSGLYSHPYYWAPFILVGEPK